MSIIENIWILTTLVIIVFVLSTDPKTPSSGGSENNQLSMLFSSVSEGQKSIRTFIWILITCFYVLSLLTSYY